MYMTDYVCVCFYQVLVMYISTFSHHSEHRLHMGSRYDDEGMYRTSQHIPIEGKLKLFLFIYFYTLDVLHPCKESIK